MTGLVTLFPKQLLLVSALDDVCLLSLYALLNTTALFFNNFHNHM